MTTQCRGQAPLGNATCRNPAVVVVSDEQNWVPLCSLCHSYQMVLDPDSEPVVAHLSNSSTVVDDYPPSVHYELGEFILKLPRTTILALLIYARMEGPAANRGLSVVDEVLDVLGARVEDGKLVNMPRLVDVRRKLEP